MTKVKVVDLGAYKELKELRRSKKAFENYLKTLTSSQLETEVNYLLDESSRDKQSKDFLYKSQSILAEIKSRAHEYVKPQIKLLDLGEYDL